MLTYSGFTPTNADQRQWTLPAILTERATTHSDKIYLSAPAWGVSLSYRETLDASTAIAQGFLARGHACGDRLVIMMPNNPEYILAWFGSSLAGMVEVPINTAYRGTFFEHQISTVRPTGAVITADMTDRFIGSSAAAATVQAIYVVGKGSEVTSAIEALGRGGFRAEPFTGLYENTAAETLLPTVDYRELASIFFTSGTTGLSKGVAMSHSHMYFFADQGAGLVRLTEDDTYLSVGPLFHGNAQFLAAYPSLLKGATFVLHEKFSASNWTTWIRDSGATVTNLVGVMSDFLWKQPTSPLDGENDLRCVWAVPNPSRIAEEFKTRFGIAELVENFGSTEVSMPILTPYGVPRPDGAAGLAVEDWFDVRLVHPDTDVEVPAGQVGELVVRPKTPWTITDGYYNMDDKTLSATRNCWFHTGDGLRRDKDGWYYFVDRLKDSIRRRGENISSYEVEQAILSHSEIEECAVVAVPADGHSSEDEVMAALVLKEGVEFDSDEFWMHCSKSMPAFAVPRFLRIVDELPKTPSGKLRKAQIRELGREGALDRQAPV